MSAQNHRDYLNSLVPPSQAEFTHIAQIQAEREAEIRRRSHEAQRQSFDLEHDHVPSHHGHTHSPGHTRSSSLLERLGLGHLRAQRPHRHSD